MHSTASFSRSPRTQLSLAACAFGLAAIVASTAVAQNALDPKPRDSGARPGTPTNGRAGQNPRPNGSGPRNQPGLGGGNALDHNLQRGSGGVNQRSVQTDFGARNFIVTDSVAGGRGFRGSVGYTAAEDFRGATGGDTNYSFRANSALSASYLLSLGTQDRFSLAQDFGLFEYRRDATPDSMNAGSATSARIRLDRSAAAISSGRMFEYEAEPATFARGQDSNQRTIEYLASPVQGLRSRRADNVVETSGLSTFERARVRRDATDGRVDASKPITPFVSPLFGDSRSDELRRDARVEPATPGQPPKTKPTSSYDQIIQRIVERYGSDPNAHIDANPNAIDRAKSELTRIRDAMNGQRSRDSKAEKDDVLIDPITGLPKKPSAGREEPKSGEQADPNGKGENQKSETDEARREREAKEIKESVAAAGEALRHGTTVHDLTPGERARVDELVRDGQQLIASGDYFRAERCFDQALELNPDNPLLFAGLAHCQIGAGLHLSAALTLRTLFSNHPEMIDTRYDRALLPNETRLRLAVENLRKRANGGQDADAYGLALAYIGHQLSDDKLVADGLAAVKGTIENDLLNQLLNQIWLKKESAQPTPAGDEKPTAPPADGAGEATK
jgi:tetratricopeptide (TPR) repeat protein